MNKKLKIMSSFILVLTLVSVLLAGCSLKGKNEQVYSATDLTNLRGVAYNYEGGELDRRLGLGYSFTKVEEEFKEKEKLSATFIPDLGYLFSYVTDEGLDFINQMSSNKITNDIQDLSTFFVDYGLLYRISSDADLSEEANALINSFKNKQEVSNSNGYKYYFAWNDEFSSKIKQEDRDNLMKLIDNKDLFIKESCIFTASEEKIHMKKLDAETLDGGKFNNENLEKYDLTMVNIWSTWCTGCIDKMPELQSLYKNLPENINMISICSDADANHKLAKDILDKNKCDFDTIMPNDDLEGSLLKYIDGFPTTIFVDKKGNIIGDPITGAATDNGNFVEGYLKIISDRLKLIN